MDLERVERKRQRDKDRKGKKNITGDDQDSIKLKGDVSLDTDDDKYDGASKEVKRLLRYRTKNLDSLKQFW
jgi:hypothetical protein